MDIYLYPEAYARTDIILSLGARSPAVVPTVGGLFGGGGRRSRRKIRVPAGTPPVAVSLHDALTERYGVAEGKRVWSKMLAGREGPFGEGKKYDPAKKRVAKKLRDAGLEELL